MSDIVIDFLFDVTIQLAWLNCCLLLGFAFGRLVVVPSATWIARTLEEAKPRPEAETFVIDEEKGYDE